MKPATRLLLVFLVCVITIPAFAATFIVPEDKVLIDRADAIVIGVVQTSEAELTEGRGVFTFTDVLVTEVLAGSGVESGKVVTLREPGGRTDTISLVLHGVPQYEPGDRVMIMLKRDERPGLWRTHEYALGRFGFVRDDFGRDFLVRDRENICGWAPGFKPYREQARRQEPFLDYVRAVGSGEDAKADYLVDFEEVCISGGGSNLTSAHAPLTANAASDYLSLCNCRWNNNATATFETTGSQSGYTDSRSDASTGMAAWNNHGESNINYFLGGTGGGSQGFVSFDDINSIIFNDPSNEVNGAGCFTGSGTLAIGGPWFGGSHSFAGETLATIAGVDVVVDCGVNPSNGISQAAFQAILAHELGHTLGFRHSNEPPCVGCDTASSALMASTINAGPGNASLLAWDERAAAAAYGSGTTTCTAVSITGHPQSTSIASGASANLSVSVGGTGPFTFQWFRGTSGTTTNPVGTNSSSFNTGALTQTTSFWVRVTNCTDKTANSNTATVTVTDCTLPQVTSEPQDVTITSGTSATLSIAASGTAPITFQWFRHIGGNTFQAVTGQISETSFNTGALTSNQLYLAVVRNPCATGDDIRSRVVSVTVTTSCTQPSITTQPASVTINSGQSATLSVAASGTSLSFQWFRGTTGVTTNPVGTNASSFNTGALTQTTSFWVRVTNACGAVNSQTATVTVASACPPGKLCSLGGRFELSLGVRDHRTNKTGTGTPLGQNDLFGFFSLPQFTGDPNNPEVFVKMLDGRPVNGNFWAFFGGLTDLEYTLSVFDKQLGTTKHYFKPGGTSNGGFDVGGGVSPETCVGEVDGIPAGFESPTVCSAGSDRLCLNGTRFRVTLSARNHRTNDTAPGVSIPQGNIFGYFALPGLTQDPNNPEVFIKVIDGRAVNGFHWVFFSGLTDFEYTLTVVDTFTGERKAYTKAPGSACGFFDTSAF